MAFFNFVGIGTHLAAFATIFGFAMTASSAPRAAGFEQQGDAGFVDADTLKGTCE